MRSAEDVRSGLADEAKFVDLEQTRVFMTEEHPIFDL